jgi:Ca-activated chloride channel family protein
MMIMKKQYRHLQIPKEFQINSLDFLEWILGKNFLNAWRKIFSQRVPFQKIQTIYLKFFMLSLILLMGVTPIQASTWENIWSRPDEQGAKLLREGKAKEASRLFEDPEWRSVANYRAGNYKKAADNFSRFNTDRAFYNRGNALAHLGKYKEAIQAYNEALKRDPKNEDAIYNRDVLKKLLEQEKQNKKQENKQSSQKDQQTEQQQKSENNKEDGQENSSQSSSSEKKESGKSRSEKENADRKPSTPDQQSSANNKEQGKESPKGSENKSGQKDTKQGSKEENAKKDKAEQKAESNPKQKEQEQATKQWLSQIPDDPGGLLRQKFLRDYQRMQAQSRSEE